MPSYASFFWRKCPWLDRSWFFLTVYVQQSLTRKSLCGHGMSQIRFDSLHCTERTLYCGSGYGHAGKYVQYTEYTRMKNGIGLIEGTLYIRGSFVAILPFHPPAPQFLLERLWGNTNHVICIRSVYLVSCIIFFNSEAIVGIRFCAMYRGSAFNRLFKRRLSRMFLSLDLLSEYRIQHGAIGPLYVTSSYSTWIFCRGVSGFATDCPCHVWCRW